MAGGCGVAGGRVLAAGWGRPGGGGAGRQAGAMAEGGQVGGGGRKERRLPPEVNRALYVRNLPFKITAEEMYDIFGKYGALRQVRLGNAADTRGTAFVVYEDIYDAKNAVDHLSGFNVCGRYLVVLFYQQTKMQKRLDTEREAAELAEMRRRLGIDGGDAGATLHKAT